MMYFHSRFRTRKGFTLVETLVAIAILMIAIVVPYFSIQQAIMTSYTARDQLIASQLAQEGEEYIYFKRDTNYLASRTWLYGLDACLSAYGCAVDPAQDRMMACPSQGCQAMKQTPSGLYTLVGSYPTTRFTRTVKITTLSSTEVQVTVTVNWITGHTSYSVNTVEDLYNWL